MKLSKINVYVVSGIISVCMLVAGVGYAVRRSSQRAQLAPEQAKDYFKRGAQLLNEGDTHGGRAVYEELIARMPQSANAYIGLGQSYEFENDVAQALTCYKKAVELDPDNALAHIACAGSYFLLGDLATGFAEYEWRWKNSNMPHMPRKWDGSPLQGKTILLLSESGLGDVIQFLRFARDLKAQGARIIAQLMPSLVPLATLTGYFDEIIVPGQRPSANDMATSFQSLPFLLKVTADTLVKGPYMHADVALEKAWKKKLASDTSFKVGLCWQAGGQAGHVPQGRRSIPLALFAPLGQLKNVTFYSLQKGDALDQLKDLPAGFKVVDFGADFDETHGAFMDTAAVMRTLDLIITIDTSVAHLAGALGVPTWTLLPFVPDPRWMLDRTDTPWYASMRLFRQPKVGDWQAVIAQVKDALVSHLDNLVASHKKDEQIVSAVDNKVVSHVDDAKFAHAKQLHMQGKYDAALAAYKELAKANPASRDAQIALGGFYEKQNDIDAALACYKKAIACAPHDPVAHICASPAYLARGDYQNWMREYAWRWHEGSEKLGARWWDGVSSLQGKKILLLADNALGDMMQFVRYAKLLKNQGAQVIVQAPQALHALFSSCCPYIDQVVAENDMHAGDVVYPLQLLPGIFTKGAKTIPQPPYMQGPDRLVAQWHDVLQQDKNLKIGICWQTTHDSESVPESKRSIPLALIKDLARQKQVTLYSLQKGADAKQLKAYGIKDFGADFDVSHGAFMDTAAIMRNLDLVITIDTSVAHLAGALGVPVWVMLPKAADVRWMLARTDTPWYPSMRLFRQQKVGDWQPVVSEVFHKLGFEKKRLRRV